MQTPISDSQTLLLNWDSILVQTPLASAIILGVMLAYLLWFLVSRYYRAKLGGNRKRFKQAFASKTEAQQQLSTALSTTAQAFQAAELESRSQQQRAEQLYQEQQVMQEQFRHLLALESQVEQDCQYLQERFSLAIDSTDTAVNTLQTVSDRYRKISSALSTRLDNLEKQHAELQQEKGQQSLLLAKQENTIQELQHAVGTQTTLMESLQQDFDAQQARLKHQQAQLSNELTHLRAQLQHRTEPDALHQAVVDNLHTPDDALVTSLPVDNEPETGVVNETLEKHIEPLIQPATNEVNRASDQIKSSFAGDDQLDSGGDSVSPSSPKIVEPLLSKPETAPVIDVQTAPAAIAETSLFKLKKIFGLTPKEMQEDDQVPVSPSSSSSAEIIDGSVTNSDKDELRVVDGLTGRPGSFAPDIADMAKERERYQDISIDESESLSTQLKNFFGIGKDSLNDTLESFSESPDVDAEREPVIEKKRVFPEKLKDFLAKITFTQ